MLQIEEFSCVSLTISYASYCIRLDVFFCFKIVFNKEISLRSFVGFAVNLTILALLSFLLLYIESGVAQCIHLYGTVTNKY